MGPIVLTSPDRSYCHGASTTSFELWTARLSPADKLLFALLFAAFVH